MVEFDKEAFKRKARLAEDATTRAYNRSEYIVAILTGVFGFAGGYGASKSKKK